MLNRDLKASTQTYELLVTTRDEDEKGEEEEDDHEHIQLENVPYEKLLFNHPVGGFSMKKITEDSSVATTTKRSENGIKPRKNNVEGGEKHLNGRSKKITATVT